MTQSERVRAIYTVACFMAGAGTINNFQVQQLIAYSYTPVLRLWRIS